MKGRKPMSNALKIARGNPGHRPLNANEPELPAPAHLKAPKGMTGRAKAEWVRLVDSLVASGTLTIADMHGFEQYCELVGEIAELKANLRTLTFDDPNARRHLIHLAKLRGLCRQQEAELGMSPTSRSRVSAVAAPGAALSERAKIRERFFGKALP